MATTAPQGFQWPQLGGAQSPQWLTAKDYDIAQGFPPRMDELASRGLMPQQSQAPAMPSFMRSPMTAGPFSAGGGRGSGGTMYNPQKLRLGGYKSYEDYMRDYQAGRPAPYAINTNRGPSGYSGPPVLPWGREDWSRANTIMQQIFEPAPERRNIYGQLEQGLSDPSSFSRHPAYQFLFNQGTEALNRTAAAKRMRFAGKTLLDAQQFGQGLANTYSDNWLRNLMSGSQEERARWNIDEETRRAMIPFRLSQL